MIRALTGHPTVDAISQIQLEGNLVPHSWYRHIRYENKRGVYSDHLACLILADIVYWYRPVAVRDEVTGEVIGWKKKFAEDKLRRSTDAFADALGATSRQIRASMALLEELNLIEVELRSVHTGLGTMPNLMFISLNPQAVMDISYRPQKATTLENSFLPKSVTSNDEMGNKVSRNGEQAVTKWGTSSDEMGNSSIYRDYSEITPKITHTYLERAQEKIEPEPIEASAEVEKSVPEDPPTTFTEPTQISRQPDDLSLGKDSGAATVAVITEPLVITEPSRTPPIDKLPSASSEHRRATPTTPAQPTPNELKEVSRQLRELQVNPDSCRGVIIKYWANVQGAIALLKNFKGARNSIAVFINACKEGTAPESNLRPRSAIPEELRPPSVEQAAALDAAKNRALIRDYFFSTVDGVTKVVLTGGRQLPWWEFLEISQC